MKQAHRIALAYPCRLAVETVHPRYKRFFGAGKSIILTVNTGYE